MGLAPRDLDRLSLWEFHALAGAHARAGDPDGADGLDDSAAEDLESWVLGHE